MSFRLCVALARTDESILNPNYGQHQQQQQLPTPPTTSSSSTTSAQRRFNNDIDSDDEDDEIDIGVVASSATSPQLTVISRADSDAKDSRCSCQGTTPSSNTIRRNRQRKQYRCISSTSQRNVNAGLMFCFYSIIV